MAEYGISGIWKNDNNVITHYAFHTVYEKTISRANKTSKIKAIELLEMHGNYANTFVWNYSSASWVIGEKAEVVNGSKGKYLRSNKDNKLTDNLGHLIDLDWIFSN